MTTLSQALAVIIGRLMPTSDPEVADAIKRLTGSSTPVPPGPIPVDPKPTDPKPTDPQEPDDGNDPPEPPDYEDPNEPDDQEPDAPEEEEPQTPEKPDDPQVPVPTPTSPTAFDPNKLPSAYIDVTNASWKLNLDRQLNGAKTGYSPTVFSKKGTPQLETYKSEEFKVVPEGVLFAADVDGIKTSSSTKYARTELRGTWPKTAERDTPYNKQFLPATGETRLVSEFFVRQFSKRADGKAGRVCIGQIHGPDDELCRFYVDPYRDMTIYRPDGKTATGDTDFYYVNDKSSFNGTATGEKIIGLYDANGKGAKYDGGKVVRTIEVKAGVMTVTAVYKGATYRAIEPLSSFWKGANAWCYWKDGVYLAQHNLATTEGQKGSGRAEVVFQRIELEYGPTLQTQKS